MLHVLRLLRPHATLDRRPRVLSESVQPSPVCALASERSRQQSSGNARFATRPAGSSARFAGALALAASLALSACGGGSGTGQIGTPSTFVPASQFEYPASIQGSPAGFYVDPNEGGGASDLHLVQVAWGRLVDVYDRNTTSGIETLRFRNFVIGEEIQTDGLDYRLDTNAVTQAQSLVILHTFGSSAFDTALKSANGNLGPVNPQSDLPGTLPPFSYVPRNAAIVLQFSDLLDPETISGTTIRLLTGNPPTQPFEARVISDPNFGSIVSSGGQKQFRPTRVIVDTTVSELEASAAVPPLSVNVLGLPAAATTFQPSASIRIATKLDFGSGQFELLQNTTGHPLDIASNNPVDIGSSTNDVVRALRAGGPEPITGDSNNGFLLDVTPPKVLGLFQVSVGSVIDDLIAGDGNYLVDLNFATVSCAQSPAIGDVLELPNALAVVTQLSTPPSLGLLNDVHMRLLTGSEAALLAGGQAIYKTAFDASEDIGQAPCFVGFFPAPTQPPVTKVDPASQVVVRFTEPMDPASVDPFDSLIVSRISAGLKGDDIVVGNVQKSAGLDEFGLQPLLPFHHISGATESYFVTLVSGGVSGLTDLAGNGLAGTFPQVTFTLNSTAPTGRRGNFALRFNSISDLKEGTGGGATDTFPELRDSGIVRDIPNGIVRPRAVSRFAGTLDRTPGTIGSFGVPLFVDGTAPTGPPNINTSVVVPPGGTGGPTLTPFAGGFREPFNHLGSRMMTVLRYCDMGLSAMDEATINIDVENISWSPLGGNVIGEFFQSFQMEFAHSARFPDEYIDPSGAFPPGCAIRVNLPLSGLVKTAFSDNVLNDPLNSEVVVHQKGLGYLVDPLNKYLAGVSATTAFIRFPLNQGNPDTWKYYTWRDTAVLATGGIGSLGVEPGIVVYGVNGNTPLTDAIYCGAAAPPMGSGLDLEGKVADATATEGNVPSIYLPLLLDFKCFPTGSSVSLNALDGNFVDLFAGGVSTFPFFTLYSAGGTDTSGVAQQKFPESEQIPTYGFNENPLWGPEGTPTGGGWESFRINQRAEFVVRVTRVPTVWFDATGAATFATPVVLPDNSEQPTGTSIVLAFRSASAITGSGNNPPNGIMTNANGVNAYGDEPFLGALFGDPNKYVGTENASLTFLGGDKSWKNTIQQINGSRFFQLRLTFVNNPANNLSPVLDGLGVAWTLP